MKTVNKTFVVALLLSLLMLLMLVQSPAANPVEGSVSIPQFGPPSKATVEKTRAEASAVFREELFLWLKENMQIEVDTVNTIKKYALQKFAERCIEAAEEKTITKGRVWTLSLVASESAVRGALRAHNDNYDAQAELHFQDARGSDLNTALPGAVRALCAAMAKIEPAGAKTGVSIDDIRANVQIIFDKMEVKVNGTVIEGRPGSLPSKVPSATFTIDGEPLTDFHVTAFVQGGRQYARTVTDSRGEVALRNHKTPFVHNGSMLTVSPDARDFIKAEHFVRYRDLGIRFTKNQELAFIYKIPALTYTLEYRASTEDKSITIPPDFTADAHVRKYLKDFCGLTPAKSVSAADLVIRINTAFTRTTFNETEEDAMLMTSTMDVRGNNVDKSMKSVFEKRHEFGTSLQMGNYFWEASGALRELIANTLSKN